MVLITQNMSTMTEWILLHVGPMKGVIPTPNTGPFFNEMLDIEAKIKLTPDIQNSTRHLTLDIQIFKSTLGIGTFSRSTSLTLTPPSWALYVGKSMRKYKRRIRYATINSICYNCNLEKSVLVLASQCQMLHNIASFNSLSIALFGKN